MITADSTTISDNVKAYFLLKLSELGKGHRSCVLASIGNSYDPKLMAEAMRVHFADLHKSETRYKDSYYKGRGDHRRHAYAADAEYDASDDWESAAAATANDDEYGEGGATDLEEELYVSRDDVENGDELAED